jgi:hypothetical protein
MKDMKKGFRIFCFCLLLAGCRGGNDMSPVHYYRFFKSEDESILRSIQTGEVIYRIKLLTPEFFALKELREPAEFDARLYLKRFNEIKGNIYFIIDIVAPEAQDVEREPHRKAKLISYYQNHAVSDILLTDGQNSVRPSYVNYEDNFGLSPHNRLLVCFEHNPGEVQDGRIILNINDPVNGNPNIKAAYSNSDIKALPKLKF